MAVGSDALGRRYLKQTAVYWAPAGTNESGETKFADPILIPCRWTDANELFMDKTGRQTVSRAKVMVDRPLAIGGAIGLMPAGGGLGDYGSNPFVTPGGFEIKAFKDIPDRRATKHYREAVL